MLPVGLCFRLVCASGWFVRMENINGTPIMLKTFKEQLRLKLDVLIKSHTTLLMRNVEAGLFFHLEPEGARVKVSPLFFLIICRVLNFLSGYKT